MKQRIERIGALDRSARRWHRIARVLGSLALLTGTTGWLAACDGDDERPGPQTPTTTAQAAEVEDETRTKPREELEPWRSLFQEAARAEIDDGGLFIDLGTADQHKYTRGNWGTGWGRPRSPKNQPSHARMTKRSAWLNVLLRQPHVGVTLRARSPKTRQRLEIRTGDVVLGGATIPRTWSDVTIAFKGDALPRDTRRIDLVARRAGIEVDWMHWLRDEKSLDETNGEAGRGTSRPAGNRTTVTVSGRPRRALVAAPGRSYSFYLHVPSRATLVFDHGAESAMNFTVRVETVDHEITELFTTAAEVGTWREATVSLDDYAGQAVRLELATTGEPGAAGWGEPAIYRPRQADESSTTKADEPSNAQANAQATNQANEPSNAPANAPAPSQPRNVILVLMDTTRADSFRRFSSRFDVHSPVMDRYASQGTAFLAAYNNESWTKPSVATLLSGLYPVTHTARWAKSRVPDDVEFFSQHLQKHGIFTMALISNAVVSRDFGFDRGWDVFDNFASTHKANGRHLYMDATDRLDKLMEKDRFFLYIQSVDAHTPYQVSERDTRHYFEGEYRGRIGSAFSEEEQRGVANGNLDLDETDWDWLWALYHGEVTFQDRQLGKFLSRVEELGLLDDTLLVLTNDHGEEFNDHDRMGHGWRLYDELVRAPLVIHYPPLFPAGETIDTIVEHVDLAPTLVEALGLPAMRNTDGLSFLPMIKGTSVRQRPWYTLSSSVNGMRAIRVGRWKLHTGETMGWMRLHDLHEDSAEQISLHETALIAGRLCDIYLGEALASPSKLQRLQDSVTRREFRSRNIVMSDKLRREMQALGYLSIDPATDSSETLADTDSTADSDSEENGDGDELGSDGAGQSGK